MGFQHGHQLQRIYQLLNVKKWYPSPFSISYHGAVESVTSFVQYGPKQIDQALLHARFSQDNIILPGWTNCNQILSTDSLSLSSIGYLPVIDASPTDKSTVNTILERSLDIANELSLPAIVIVFDQAIYAKAQEIRWQGRPEFRNKLVIRLGEFHTAMAFLGVIGKRFADAGLKDIAVESGLVAEGSISGVISGHHYNRSVRCHKLLSEALHRLRIQDYLDQLPIDNRQEVLVIMQDIVDHFPTAFMNSIEKESVRNFFKDYEDHVQARSHENNMYSFWSSYLEMVELLLLFIRATREGNWDLHLAAIRDMIPWLFSYGRINYSRYLPVYYLEMKDLPSTHPFVHHHLSSGQFAVKRHEDHSFALTACDQVIEQTFNRDSKTRGGLTGITLQKGAVRRWILSHPSRAAIANACYTMSSTTSIMQPCKPQNKTARVLTDEQAVQDVMMTVKNFSNPFAHEDKKELFNICSGKIAPQSIISDLFTAFPKGEQCFQTFVKERLIERQKDVFDKLSLPTGKTFTDIGKEVSSKSRKSTAMLKEQRDLLARILMTAQEKGLQLKELFRYPLCSVPSALADFDGSMVKTRKAALLKEMEKHATNSDGDLHGNENVVVIVDAMVLIQQQKVFGETFGECSSIVLKNVISLAKKHCAVRVDFVADRYRERSIKNAEREGRAKQGETKFNIKSADQKTPKQMTKFLANGDNKEGFLKFIVQEWKLKSADKLFGLDLYATQGDKCFKLSATDKGTLLVEDVPELHSDHEEADTRMLQLSCRTYKDYNLYCRHRCICPCPLGVNSSFGKVDAVSQDFKS